MKLGTLLLRNDVISLGQLENALRTQVLYGGRLGTNLVEQGVLDLATLAEYLAESLGVPLATQEMLDAVSEDVIRDFGAGLARRYEAFPLGFLPERPDSMAVAFVDPRDDQAVSRLSEDAGSPIWPHVAPELRIYYYLERHYGITRKARFVRVGSPQPVPAKLAERRRTQPAGGIVTPPALRVEPRSKADAPTMSLAAAAQAVNHQGADEPSDSLLSYREACAAIDRAGSREAIGDALIDYARGRFAVAVIFLLRDGNALGWRMHHADERRADYPIEELSLPLGGTSALQAARDSKQPYRGPSPSPGKPVERRLWSELGVDPEPEEMLVVPILVKQRVVNLMYLHAPAGGPIDDTARKKLSELAGRAGRAYARLIQQAKKSARTQ